MSFGELKNFRALDERVKQFSRSLGKEKSEFEYLSAAGIENVSISVRSDHLQLSQSKVQVADLMTKLQNEHMLITCMQALSAHK